MSDVLMTERRGRILILTLNRPEARNAMTAELARAIATAVGDLDSDSGLSLGVLTGAGVGFCAGMDLKALVTGDSGSAGPGKGFGGITEADRSKPLIAAVEGFAVAGGLELALACDLIVAARGAKLGLPEVTRGLVAAAGGLMRLPRALPYALAMEMAITGEPILAERAHELGLVNRLVEPGTALDAALELAEVIGRNSPAAVRATRQIVTRGVRLTDEEYWHMQKPFVAAAGATGDGIEGAKAFAEKREPRWSS